MKHQFTSAVFVCIFSIALQLNSSAQTCYIQKTDASGIDVSQYQTVLESSACALKDALPPSFSGNFKVFSYGLYTLNPAMTNGIEQMLLRAKTQSEAESQYFLLIAKESSSQGLYTKFHVAVKLPTTGIFSCLMFQPHK